NVFEDEDKEKGKPTGALLCVHARTGKELWRYPVDNGVLKAAVADRKHVYFGSRDGHCYCLRRTDGKLVWKKQLDSAVVASPALARCPRCQDALRLYVMGSAGRVSCLDPATGSAYWTFNLGKSTHLSSTPFQAVERTPQGERRCLYFGAGLNDETRP